MIIAIGWLARLLGLLAAWLVMIVGGVATVMDVRHVNVFSVENLLIRIMVSAWLVTNE